MAGACDLEWYFLAQVRLDINPSPNAGCNHTNYIPYLSTPSVVLPTAGSCDIQWYFLGQVRLGTPFGEGQMSLACINMI